MGSLRLIKLSLFTALLCPNACLIAQESLPAPQIVNQDHLTVAQWVKPSVPGELQVRVLLPAPGGEVRLLSDAEVILIGPGNTLLGAVTDSNGDACIKGVQPGVYSLIAATPAFAGVYAMHVLADDQPGGELYPDKVEIACGRIAFEMFASLVLPLMQYEYSLDELAIENDRVPNVVTHARGNELYRVRREDSGMNGYIYAATDHGRVLDTDDLGDRLDPAERMKVFLFSNANFVGRAVTNELGGFRFNDLPAGVYTVITVGRDGIGMVGLDLFDPETEQGDLHGEATGDPVYDSIVTPFVLGDGEIGDTAFAMQVVPVNPGLLSSLLRRCVCEPAAPLAEIGVGGGGAGGGGAGGGVAGGGRAGGGLVPFASMAILTGAVIGSGSGGGGGGSAFPTPPPASPSQ